MAQQLGLNPHKLLGNIASARQETWKAPTGDWLERIWRKRYGEREPQMPVPSEQTRGEARGTCQ